MPCMLDSKDTDYFHQSDLHSRTLETHSQTLEVVGAFCLRPESLVIVIMVVEVPDDLGPAATWQSRLTSTGGSAD